MIQFNVAGSPYRESTTKDLLHYPYAVSIIKVISDAMYTYLGTMKAERREKETMIK